MLFSPSILAHYSSLTPDTFIRNLPNLLGLLGWTSEHPMSLLKLILINLGVCDSRGGISTISTFLPMSKNMGLGTMVVLIKLKMSLNGRGDLPESAHIHLDQIEASLSSPEPILSSPWGRRHLRPARCHAPSNSTPFKYHTPNNLSSSIRANGGGDIFGLICHIPPRVIFF